MPLSADRRGWGRGWPANRQADMVQVRGGGVSVPAGVHREIAELTRLLLDETVRRGYRLVPGWCWGYARRPIRGTLRPSNHSWGLAVDLNAPRNAQGTRGDIPDHIVSLWERYGWEWGGWWKGRARDPMHFEFAGDRDDALLMTQAASRDLRPGNKPPPLPPQPSTQPSGDDMITLVHIPGENLWWALAGNTKRPLAPGEPDALFLLGVLNPRNIANNEIRPLQIRREYLDRIPLAQ